MWGLRGLRGLINIFIAVLQTFAGRRWKYNIRNPDLGLKDVDPKTGLKTTKRLMLLVLSEQGSNRIVIYYIKNADEKTIRPIIQRHIIPGGEVHTDGAKVCCTKKFHSGETTGIRLSCTLTGS